MVSQKALIKAETKAARAQAKLTAQNKNKNKGRSKKPRPSIFGWVSFFVAPLVYFFAGVPGISGGVMHSSYGRSGAARLYGGLRSILLAYSGFDIKTRSFNLVGALFGWTPILTYWIIRKAGVNRLVPAGNPVIL